MAVVNRQNEPAGFSASELNHINKPWQEGFNRMDGEFGDGWV
jgi:hypothetical protein